MALMGVFDVAASGLSAQNVRLNTVASNLANAESVSSSIAQTYRARVPVFQAILENEHGRVSRRYGSEGLSKVEVAAIVESPAPVRKEYRPDHPLADPQGYVYFPNVNVMEQMADMIAASSSYRANVEMAMTARELLLRTLELGR